MASACHKSMDGIIPAMGSRIPLWAVRTRSVVQAKAFSREGAWELLPHCAHVVRPSLWIVH
jgi:hypothetical protein